MVLTPFVLERTICALNSHYGNLGTRQRAAMACMLIFCNVVLEKEYCRDQKSCSTRSCKQMRM